MHDQMDNPVAHSQILVAKCNHLVADWSPEHGSLNMSCVNVQTCKVFYIKVRLSLVVCLFKFI